MLAHQILDKVTLSDSLPVINPTHKTCTKCHQSKLLCDFYQKKDSKHGVKAACKVCIKKYSKTHYLDNKERKIESSTVWNKANKERHSEYSKIWNKANPDKCRSYQSRRRAAKRNAFPMWARAGKIKERIDAIYTEAKDLELFHQTNYHVDHIIPLQSNFVCGLHVPANLQPLPGIENISKSNSFIPYIENSSEIEINMVELTKMVKDFIADPAQSNFLG